MKLKPVVIVDTREQEPFRFTNLVSERATLTTGDYSIRGLEHLVCCERKSLDDLLGCIGRERDRFKRELQRMQAHRFRLLIVETDAEEIERGDWRSQLKPTHVFGALASWSGQYQLPVWLGGSHAASGRYVERWLFQCAKHVADELRAVCDDSPLSQGAGAFTDMGALAPAGV